MKTAEAHHPRAGESEPQLSPEEFETLRRAYEVKNGQYLPAVERLADEGRLDRLALRRLEAVRRSHIHMGGSEKNETGERFASADVRGGLVVPDERYVPHEATHLLGGVAWTPLNEGLTQLVTDKITDEMSWEAQPLYEENKHFAHAVVRLAGFTLTPGSDLEDVNWARLSRLFCGEDMEENFNELDALVRRRTGADTLGAMRDLQQKSTYLLHARQRVGATAWEQLKSSERQALEVQEMTRIIESITEKISQRKTSRPLGRTAGEMWRPER